MARIAHLSDVHFGTEDPAVVEGLVADVAAFAPDVTVLSGDLTQRARTEEFRAARALLDRLPGAVAGTFVGGTQVVVPGNHDVPLFDLVRRAFAPRGRFHRIVTPDRTPFVEAHGAAVLGLDTTRPEVWKNGELERDDVEAITRRLGPLPDTVLKVVVTHHPFVAPPSRPDSSIVVGAGRALAAASAAGVDLLLSGHRHTAHRDDIRSAHPDTARGMLVIMAGTATSERRRGEPNSWTTIDGDATALTLTDREWDGRAFVAGDTGRYARHNGAWAPVP